jgi:phage/plasmid-associated DNA primase
LCGSDPLWANVKSDDGRLVLQGDFPVILACNGKPRIHLDSDTDAWMRRLVVLSLKTPDHEQHFGKMAELILKNEASGILNWLLEGRAKLAKDKLQLVQTPEQKERAATLLLASDSPAAFVRSSIRKEKGGVIWGAELYEQYQKWCRNLALRPFAAKEFMKAAKEEIETGFGIRPRHDLVRDNGKAGRGWSGLAVVMKKGAAENLENQSVLSA